MKRLNVTFGAILLVLGCFALSPTVWAVSPPPDGGYANFNTAEGQNALNSLTTGIWNVANGAFALWHNTDGSYNTAVGTGALLFNIGDQSTGEGTQNTAVGAAALLLNTTGSANSALGVLALQNNTTGSNNTAIGWKALVNNDSSGNGTANDNTGVGEGALLNNIDGNSNTAVGFDALHNNTADYNTALGWSAGTASGLGSNNILIGDTGFSGYFDVIAIGAIPSSGTPYSRTYIGGIYNSVEQDRPVYVDSHGHLGSPASSRRYKEEIKPMDKGSEALFALKPVTFRYKEQIDASHRLCFGLVAEDVAKVSADLISRDKEGKPQTVRYDAVNAMLLNEFLKEHKKVEKQSREMQEQKATIAALRKRLVTVVAQLNKQAAQIQKVDVQLQLSKGAAKTVADRK